MSLTPADEADHSDDEANNQADMLKDQLRKDVASWSAARSGASARQAVELSVPAAPQPVKRVKRSVPASPDVNTTDPSPKKPFSMSYDGVSEADYITYMIARGAR